MVAVALAWSAVGGCTVDATGALVTLRMNGIEPASLRITVQHDEAVIGQGAYGGPGTRIPDGATFGVVLPDSLDGGEVMIVVEAYDATQPVANRLGAGHVSLRVARHLAVPVTVEIDGTVADLAADTSEPPDLGGDLESEADLARDEADLHPEPDLADGDLPPDMAVPDLEMPDAPADLATADAQPDSGCVRACADGGMLSTCTVPDTVMCAAGCDPNGVDCLVPTCKTPKDIALGGQFKGDNGGGPNNLSGSCGGQGGPESVFQFTVTDYSDVKLDLSAMAVTPVLYTRRSPCATGTEMFAGGPCTMTAQVAACAVGGQKLTQTLCGVPPGTYYTVVDNKSGLGGAFDLDATFAPDSLNVCASAGMVPGPYPALVALVQGGKQGTQDLNRAPVMTPNCGDLGTGPESVYYVPQPVPLEAGQHLTVKLLAWTPNNYKPILYVQRQCQPATTMCSDGMIFMDGKPYVDIAGPAGAGPYFVFVDGSVGSRPASFTLEVNAP